ncbi:MAG: hypothetical protein KatS3mg094_427 [Candidatus Parcubacteria bacterium]|nr:MAG: hypothetical protein KatS3mg094_427 [Candidatus Parcubacteria bacterium]
MIKIFRILLFILIIVGSFVLAQNRITVFKTDNRGFKFYYNLTSTPGYERELIIGLSNYTNDCYGNYSCSNNSSFGLPMIEFKPTGNYLATITKNIFRILNFGTKTNLIAISLLDSYYEYSRILFDPKSERVIFDEGRQNSIPFEGQFTLSRLYADIGDLIAIYSCEELGWNNNPTCLGKTGVYKDNTQPPGATRTGNFQVYQNVGFYRNPTNCFGDPDNSMSRRIDICLGNCTGDDEGLTICFRTK